jgi:hypothetical protein
MVVNTCHIAYSVHVTLLSLPHHLSFTEIITKAVKIVIILFRWNNLWWKSQWLLGPLLPQDHSQRLLCTFNSGGWYVYRVIFMLFFKLCINIQIHKPSIIEINNWNLLYRWQGWLGCSSELNHDTRPNLLLPNNNLTFLSAELNDKQLMKITYLKWQTLPLRTERFEIK